MRRTVLLLFALLLLGACNSPAEPTADMLQPVSFYYRTAETDFSAADGVIRAEIRDLGDRYYTEQELFSLYFEGPRSEALRSPFTQDTTLATAQRLGSTLELYLTRDTNSPEGFDHSLTYACLTKTALALDGINKVHILVRAKSGALQEDVTLSEDDILLYDSGETARNTLDVILYYSDETDSFLLTEKRTIPMMDRQELPQTILELLASEPQSGGMKRALPAGTRILDVIVEEGLCSVDFNASFYDNRPQEEQAERLAILSVVNTLCELDEIHRVQFYSQGTPLTEYGWLDLTHPWTMDSSQVGPIHSELGEFVGILYLPGERDGLLHPLTLRTRARAGISQEEALLLALYSRTSQNGLLAPLSEMPEPLSISTSTGSCTLMLADNTLPVDSKLREQVLRSVTATLCSLSGVDRVIFQEISDSAPAEALQPRAEWFSTTSDTNTGS